MPLPARPRRVCPQPPARGRPTSARPRAFDPRVAASAGAWQAAATIAERARDSVMGGAAREMAPGIAAPRGWRTRVLSARHGFARPQSAEIGCERSERDRRARAPRPCAVDARGPQLDPPALAFDRGRARHLGGADPDLPGFEVIEESAQVARPGPVMRQQERGDRPGLTPTPGSIVARVRGPRRPPRARPSRRSWEHGQLRDERPLVPARRGRPSTTRSPSVAPECSTCADEGRPRATLAAGPAIGRRDGGEGTDPPRGAEAAVRARADRAHDQRDRGSARSGAVRRRARAGE